MRYLLLLVLALLFLPTPQSQEGSPIVVLSFKWSKTRQVPEKIEVPNTSPAPAPIPQNKNFERNVRVNDQVGARDPNLDTEDGRSAAMEKNVQQSRTTQPKPVDAFLYKIKLENSSAQAVDIVFWEYQFIERANPQNVTRRQFLCGTSIKPGKAKDVEAFSLSGPSDTVNVKTLATNADKPFEEKVVINRVEYTDGAIWQRKDWNFGEIRTSYRRALATPWTNKEMCRGL